MSPEEYKATRERLGMTQAALAVALDVSRKAINQREQGGTITREAAMALELLALRSPKRSRKSENAELSHGALAPLRSASGSSRLPTTPEE